MGCIWPPGSDRAARISLILPSACKPRTGSGDFVSPPARSGPDPSPRASRIASARVIFRSIFLRKKSIAVSISWGRSSSHCPLICISGTLRRASSANSASVSASSPKESCQLYSTIQSSPKKAGPTLPDSRVESFRCSLMPRPVLRRSHQEGSSTPKPFCSSRGADWRRKS